MSDDAKRVADKLAVKRQKGGDSMADLVERLRAGVVISFDSLGAVESRSDQLMDKAADEIERLRAAIDRIRATIDRSGLELSLCSVCGEKTLGVVPTDCKHCIGGRQ